MDINKVWLSGLVVTQPVMTRQKHVTTTIVNFTLQCNEKFVDKRGNPQVKTNLIRIECLGKTAEQAIERVKEGQRYVVDGYVRQDSYEDGENVRIRAFAVYPEDSATSDHYYEGVKQAIHVLKNSRDKNAALEKLADILKKG